MGDLVGLGLLANARYISEVEPPRLPPCSPEAEQAVLGGLLLDNSAWDKISDRLAVDDFYRHDHGILFRAIEEMVKRERPFDPLTLSDHLRDAGTLDEAGGMGYVASLAADTPSAANIEAYADIVRDMSVRRGLIKASTAIADTAYDPEGKTAEELVEGAEQAMSAIADAGGGGRVGAEHIDGILSRVVQRIDELYENGAHITGVATGFNVLDERTMGLQRGDLVIVAARPSMGKTALAMNIAENAALDGRRVAVFSMEMPSEQLVIRLMSSISRVDQTKLRSGRLGDDDWPRITHALQTLQSTEIFIDDTPAITPTELRARCRRLARKHGQLDLVLVDYLQLMRLRGSKENRTQEISEISRSLKALAKEMEVPVVALSQLNRSLEHRPDKRPVMSDLRESGAIEQDADVILFIYRDEVYNEDSPDRGTAEIIIAKQRNGPIGKVRLSFRNHLTRFENHIPDTSQVYGGYALDE